MPILESKYGGLLCAVDAGVGEYCVSIKDPVPVVVRGFFLWLFNIKQKLNSCHFCRKMVTFAE
jgi:hypothetical protein